MEREPLADVLREIVRKHAAFAVGAIAEDDLVTGDLGLDSLGLLLSLGDVEERLGFSFPMERLGDVRELRFGAFVDLVRSALNQPR